MFTILQRGATLTEAGVNRPANPRGQVPPARGWLLPALAIGVLAIGLVVAGVVSLSTVLYAGAFGGMLLMHLGGHGHGHGNGGHGGGAHGGGHSNDPQPRPRWLSAAARQAQVIGPDERAARQPNRTEGHDGE